MYHRVQLFIFLLIAGNSFAQSNDTLAALQKVRSGLKGGVTIEQILTDNQWMFLHAKTEFRQLIREFANSDRLMMITSSEAGEKITIDGFVKDEKNQPVSDPLVYLYHTDNRGFYAF